MLLCYKTVFVAFCITPPVLIVLLKQISHPSMFCTAYTQSLGTWSLFQGIWGTGGGVTLDGYIHTLQTILEANRTTVHVFMLGEETLKHRERERENSMHT